MSGPTGEARGAHVIKDVARPGRIAIQVAAWEDRLEGARHWGCNPCSHLCDSPGHRCSPRIGSNDATVVRVRALRGERPAMCTKQQSHNQALPTTR